MSNSKGSPSAPRLSVVVTAHGEGILLHRTLRSALRATAKLDKQHITWELLIHVDNGTPETLSYIEANKSFLKPFEIYYNTFKDLAASRNFMVKKAKGACITFLDADDLISENWFVKGVEKLEQSTKPQVLHTEWLINFGQQNLAWRKYNSRTKAEDALIMVWANRWDSAVMAPRAVFERFPYAGNTNGYGSEDWYFGSQTLANNIPHTVIPETVIFARRRDVSEMSIQKTDYRTVHYTDLLDVEYFKHIDLATAVPDIPHDKTTNNTQKLKSLSVKVARRGYRLAASQPHLERYVKAASAYLQDKTSNQPAGRFPKWLVDEWKAIHVIDRQIFPDAQLLKEMPIYISEMYELGIAYKKLTERISKYPDYIIIVPHLVPGGADLVILNYVRALQKLHPEWHLLVISTNNTPSPWAERLPNDVDYMPWGAICDEAGIWQDLHLQLFARLIVQLKCKRLHIIQSALGFTFAEKYKNFLTSNDYTVFACAFCEDIDNEGRFIGHIHSGLPGAYPALSEIFTDNKAVVDQLVHEYGYDADRFTVHYQPAELTDIQPPIGRTSKPYRILWASRVAKQKRPDLLKKIAQELDPSTYHIDAYGSLHDGYSRAFFEETSSMSYKGVFNGLHSIDLQSYDIFLYTSANDGVPNILLGIAAGGLPIVASNAGGVGEFIQDHQTGLLVQDIEDIDAYVSAIKELHSNPDNAKMLATNAQKLLKDRHSETSFEREVKKVKF